MPVRVLRVYHGGRDPAHRERDRALVRAGIELTLVVPKTWPEGASSESFADEPFEVIALPVHRPGDVNRHRFVDPDAVAALVATRNPDVVDLHQEPFSSVVRQVLRSLPPTRPVVGYTAQNIDKRFPPPFAQWEHRALSRLQGMYPCTRQAASVVVGKGFHGAVQVLPLAPPPEVTAGAQQPPVDEVRMLLVGRMLWRKGVLDAVRTLADVRTHVPATLTLAGTGHQAEAALTLAAELGVADALTLHPWLDARALAELYRRAHVVLIPSRANRTWVEQFGRMVVEAQTAGAVVVGYASGSLPEVVGDAGVLVAEGDVPALGRAVLELHRRPEQWKTLREKGLRQAPTRDAVAAGQLTLYRQALDAPPSRPVRPQRAQAEAEYERPAQIAGGGRPFALPYLRNNTAAARPLAMALDTLSRPERRPVPERLRIVYVDHVAQLSGGELALARLLAALPEVDAHVILAEDGPLRAMLAEGGATVEVLPLDARAGELRRGDVGTGGATVRATALTAAYTLRLARRIHRLKPDAVHTNSLKSGFYGGAAAKLARVPHVWHLRDRLAEDYLPARAITLTRLALRHLPDVVVCNSAETMRTARVAAQVVPDPYRPQVPPQTRAHDGMVVGMVGRLAPWKGQDVFLRAFAAAFAEQPSVQARIVGSAMFGEHDDYAVGLRILTAELGLDGRVTFVGFTTDVEHELGRLDVLVHASVVAEPFGQVVVEGMAAGLPVVATAAGGPLEIVTPEVDGLLVTPGDVAELATALDRSANDGTLRERLGHAAQTRAHDFAPEIIGPRMVVLYREMLARRGRPRRITPATGLVSWLRLPGTP